MTDELSRLRLSPRMINELACLDVASYQGLSESTRQQMFSALVVTCVDLYDCLTRVGVLVHDGLDVPE